MMIAYKQHDHSQRLSIFDIAEWFLHPTTVALKITPSASADKYLAICFFDPI